MNKGKTQYNDKYHSVILTRVLKPTMYAETHTYTMQRNSNQNKPNLLYCFRVFQYIFFKWGGRRSSKDPQNQPNLPSHLKLIPISLTLLKYTLQNIFAFLKPMQKE